MSNNESRREEQPSSEISEMARLARIAVLTRNFLEYTMISYVFFIFSLGVITGYLIGMAVGEAGVINTGTAESLGTTVGILLSMIAYAWIRKKITIAAGIQPKTKLYRRLAISTQVFIGTMIITSIITSYFNPEKANLSWQPALAITLLTAHATSPEKEKTKPHLIAAIILLAFTPLVYILDSQSLAGGSMTLAYTIAGLYSIHKATSQLEQG